MSIDYCLPLIYEDLEESIKVIQQEQARFRYFEIWLDYLKDGQEGSLQQLCKEYPHRLVFLTRRKGLEAPHKTHEQQQEALRTLASEEVYLDFDILTQRALLDSVIKDIPKKSLLLSCHDYDQTPSNERLDEVIEMMQVYQPAIYKGSFFCTTKEDAVRLLSLQLRLQNEGKTCIILGMGSYGALTRIFGSAWGNMMTFTPRTPEECSAPGQFSRDELETILAIVERIDAR